MRGTGVAGPCSQILVDSRLSDDDEFDSKDDRILLTAGSATAAGVGDEGVVVSTWPVAAAVEDDDEKSERAFLTTDGLPRAGLTVDGNFFASLDDVDVIVVVVVV